MLISSLFALLSLSLSLLLQFCLVHSENSAYAPSQIHLSQWYTPNSMAVMWNTLKPTPTSSVLYHRGRCFDVNQQGDFIVVNGGDYKYEEYEGVLHMAVIEGLQMDETYCYQVGDLHYGFSATRQFRTPSPNSATIAAYADTGTWGNIVEVLPQLALDDDISLVLHAGDLSYAKEDLVWDTWGEMVEPVASTHPYMIIPGNWDVKPFAINAFLNRYSMPLHTLRNLKLKEQVSTRLQRAPPQYFYSFDYGPVHIIMLSSYDPYNANSSQYEWLVKDLQQADEKRVSIPWIIAAFHSPMYSSSTGHMGSDLEFRKQIEHLLHKYRVDLTITGHDHGYERTFPVFDGEPLEKGLHRYTNPGTIHILAGTGGATADPWLELPTWSAVRESTWGYTKIKATLYPTTLHVTYLRANNTIGDDFFLLKQSEPVKTRSFDFNNLLLITVVFLLIIVVVFFVRKGVQKGGLLKQISPNPTQMRWMPERQFKTFGP